MPIMKILGFADMHGSISALKKLKKKAKKADIILCLGDFTIFSDNMPYFLKKINKLGKPVLLIHGNHEFKKEVQMLVKDMKNITFFHKKSKIIGDCLFLGHGGGGFSLRDKSFDKTWAKRFKEKIKKHKKKRVVFMTHQPPYGSEVDMVWDEHCGSKSYRDFYKKNRVDVLFTGHLHETADVIEVVKGTTLINPGPKGYIVEVREDIVKVEIKKKKKKSKKKKVTKKKTKKVVKKKKVKTTKKKVTKKKKTKRKR